MVMEIGLPKLNDYTLISYTLLQYALSQELFFRRLFLHPSIPFTNIFFYFFIELTNHIVFIVHIQYSMRESWSILNAT